MKHENRSGLEAGASRADQLPHVEEWMGDVIGGVMGVIVRVDRVGAVR